METVIGIIFVVFILARVLLGKDDNGVGHRPSPGRHDDDDGEKYPPSYYEAKASQKCGAFFCHCPEF